MALATYTDLVAAVKDWSARFDSSVVARVPDFIALGEVEIWRRVRNKTYGLASLDLVIPASAQSVALPADWLAFEAVVTGNSSCPRAEYTDYWTLQATQPQGDPSLYTIDGGNFLYGQVSGSTSQTLKSRYFKHPGALQAGLTWLMTQGPDVYLYAALKQLAIYAKKPDAVGEFGTLLDRAINDLASADRGAQISGSPLRMTRR